jgi:hypothetical protein
LIKKEKIIWLLVSIYRAIVAEKTKRYHFRTSYNVNNDFARKYTDEDIEELGKQLIHFAEFDRAIHFIQFTKRFLKSKCWLNDMSDAYPRFAEYYQIARELMTSKISNLCFYDKESGVNASFGQNNLYRYDDDLNDNIEWKASLAKESSKSEQQPIHIHFPNAPTATPEGKTPSE